MHTAICFFFFCWLVEYDLSNFSGKFCLLQLQYQLCHDNYCCASVLSLWYIKLSGTFLIINKYLYFQGYISFKSENSTFFLILRLVFRYEHWAGLMLVVGFAVAEIIISALKLASEIWFKYSFTNTQTYYTHYFGIWTVYYNLYSVRMHR